MSRSNSPFSRWAMPITALLCLTFAANVRAQGPPSFVPHRLLVKFGPNATALQVRNLLKAAGASDAGSLPRTGVHIIQLPNSASELAVASAFNHRPEVSFAEVDAICRPADLTPNDSNYSTEWHLPKIKAPTAWSTTTGSSSIIIAILDTGCEGTHPDLQPKYVSGWNVYDGTSNTADVTGHGTSVAGAAAACGNNGIGVASVAWGCKIMPVRMTDTAGNTTLSLASTALTWAADHGARVANMSFALSDSTTVKSAAQYFQGKGGVVVMAAGNNATFDSTADNPYVLTVSATDQNDLICSWSNTGNNIDISAPGVGIGTTTVNGTYGFGTGTSYSAPIVAGIAALMFSVNSTLSPMQVQDGIKTSADHVGGTTGWTPQYGSGRVNAANAVAAVIAQNFAPTVATAAASANNPVTGTTTNLSVLGSDDRGEANLTYTWSSTGPSPATFSGNGTNAAKNTTATFKQAGSYNFTATITDSGGLSCTSSVNVTVSQTSSTISVSPGSASVAATKCQQFASTVKDQFGTALLTQPACAWTVTGGGTIGSAGLFTAGSNPGGPFTVSAALVSLSGMANVTVTAPDTTAPTVSITSPTGGKVSNPQAVTASATDNVGVTKVELWVDGKLNATVTASPWSFSVVTSSWKKGSSHTFQCKAYDAAGNIGLSQIVTVTK